MDVFSDPKASLAGELLPGSKLVYVCVYIYIQYLYLYIYREREIK